MIKLFKVFKLLACLQAVSTLLVIGGGGGHTINVFLYFITLVLITIVNDKETSLRRVV